VAIWQHRKRVLGIFSPRMRRNRNFRSKIWLRHRSGDLDFLYDRCISTTEWRLLDIFDIFVLLRRKTLWPWPFDLESVSCTVLLMSDQHTNYYYPMTIGYWVTSIQSLRMRRVTWPLTGGKNIPHFWNPRPQFAYQFVTFTVLRQRLSRVIGKK